MPASIALPPDRPGRSSRRRCAIALAVASLCGARTASALDRQGSAHAGSVQTTTEGRNISGGVFVGVALYNPSYAARPDNTGLALMRYGAHLDVDLIGSRLSIPIDLNAFTDRLRPGALALAPSEFDVITGLTSTFDAGPGAVELGARVEHDSPVDRPGFHQTYADLRARFLFSVANAAPGVGRALANGDVSGWVTVGWFAINPTYAARPDNTGIALFRYAAHGELSLWSDRISLGVDATMFTDRRATNPARPTELDLTGEVIGRYPPIELHVAYERDMPLDRGGLVQDFAYLLLSYTFDVGRRVPPPLEMRSPIISP